MTHFATFIQYQLLTEKTMIVSNFLPYGPHNQYQNWAIVGILKLTCSSFWKAILFSLFFEANGTLNGYQWHF